MGYSIRFMESLPAGREFMLVRTPTGARIFYREDKISPRTLEDSWAAFRATSAPQVPDDKPPTAAPAQREATVLALAASF